MSAFEIRTMRADEREPFLDLVEAAFGKRAEFARYLDADALLDANDTWLALDGDRPVSCLQIFEKPIRLRAEVVTVGGIGSVATHPRFERRGISTRLLQRAIDDMRDRGHALSLLFTGRTTFYERLDWVQIPRPTWTLTRTPSGPAPVATSRRFELGDLARIERIYDDYNLHTDTTVTRDRRYWISQLGYAGEPDEDFRVVERDGQIVAYARRIRFFGIPRITEHGCAPDACAELAQLLHELTPETGALLAQRTGVPELAQALQSRPGLSAEATQWGDTMWRVIDRARLQSLSGLPATAADADLLRTLVGDDRAVFWPSDRF